MGKGDKRRPMQISREEYAKRWDKIFKPKKPKEALMPQVRYIEGNWEVTTVGDTAYFSGPYAIWNIFSLYPNVNGRMLDEAKAHPVAFDCEALAPHFRRVIRFLNGSWERLMVDGTWAANSSLNAIRGCLVYHRLHLRPRNVKKMLDYLKMNPLLGNGVVPLQAAYAFVSLWASLFVEVT